MRCHRPREYSAADTFRLQASSCRSRGGTEAETEAAGAEVETNDRGYCGVPANGIYGVSHSGDCENDPENMGSL